jgi:hypothetical protein
MLSRSSASRNRVLYSGHRRQYDDEAYGVKGYRKVQRGAATAVPGESNKARMRVAATRGVAAADHQESRGKPRTLQSPQ